MHLFSLCSDNCSSASAHRFLAMAALHGLKYTPLQISEKWKDFKWLAQSYANASRRLHPNALVVFSDYSDVFIQKSSVQIMEAYNAVRKGRPILLSLETGCWRDRCTAIVHNDTTSGIKNLTYLNGGIVMGYAGALGDLWEHASNFSCCRLRKPHMVHSAQRGIGHFATTYPDMVTYDTTQRLTSVIVNLRSRNELTKYYEWGPNGLQNKHSKVASCFLHLPGVNSNSKRLCKSASARRNMIDPFDDLVRVLSPSNASLCKN